MKPMQNPGRVAGLAYLFVTLTGAFNLMYVPGALIVRGNATVTASNIAAHEMLFRFGMASGLVSSILEIFLVLALYRLLRSVDRNQAVLMVVLGLFTTLCNFCIVGYDAVALILVRGADFLAVFDKPQRDALAMLFLRLDGQTTNAAEIFWGLWLFPLAILVYRSRFLPRFLGIWLAINGVAYVIDSLAGILAPQLDETISTYIFPILFGEVAFMLWLVVKGVNLPLWDKCERASHAGAA